MILPSVATKSGKELSLATLHNKGVAIFTWSNSSFSACFWKGKHMLIYLLRSLLFR